MFRHAYVRMTDILVPLGIHVRSNAPAPARFAGSRYRFAVAQDHEPFREGGHLHFQPMGA